MNAIRWSFAAILLSLVNGQEVAKQHEMHLDGTTIILNCDPLDEAASAFWTIPPNSIKEQTNLLAIVMDSAKKYGTYKCYNQIGESPASLKQTHEILRPVSNINLNESLVFASLRQPYTILCPVNFGSKNTNWFRFDRNNQKWIQTRQNDWMTYQLATVTEDDITIWRCESANDIPVNGLREASLVLSKGFTTSTKVVLTSRSELEAELIVLNEDQSIFLLGCEDIQMSGQEVTWELKSTAFPNSTANHYVRLDDRPADSLSHPNVEVTMRQHDLQINKCLPNNSGVYRCTLKDGTNRYANLHVKRKEPIIDRFGRHGVQKRLVDKGENVIFHCNYDKEDVNASRLVWVFRPMGSEMDASSSVEYTIDWPGSDGISVSVVGDRIRITINDFKSKNQGRYFCKFGKLADYTDVTVSADFDVQLTMKTKDSNYLLLSCSVTRNGVVQPINNYTYTYFLESDTTETKLNSPSVTRFTEKDRHYLCKATNRVSQQTASSLPTQVRGLTLTLVADTPTGLRVGSPLTLRCVASDSSISDRQLALNLGIRRAPIPSKSPAGDGAVNFNYAEVIKRNTGNYQCVLMPRGAIKSNVVKVVVCEITERLCRDASLCYAATKNCDGRKDCADGSDEDRNQCMDCDPHSLKCQSINGVNPDVKCVMKHWICDGQNDCGNNWDEFVGNGYCNKHPTPLQNCIGCGRNESCCGDGKCFPRAYECDSEVDCADRVDETSCTCGAASQLELDSPMSEVVKTVSPGSSVELTCQVRGKERPTINWRFNWGHLPDDLRFIESMTIEQVTPEGVKGAPEMYTVKGNLLINNVNPKTDIGRYTCEAITKCKRSLFPDYILRLETQLPSTTTSSSSFERV